ncbi:MAG: HisA/HisF-related TIM barrel protein [Promethearchaeota archaeon]
MTNFRIIPVIDILNSKAVHAIKGERDKYKPFESYLFQSSDPIEIIQLINRRLGFDELYIADLDSILYKKPNFEILNEIMAIPKLEIILDPGIVDQKDITNFSGYNIKGLILGLETLKTIKVIEQSLQILEQNEIIVSVDMFKGQIISHAKDIRAHDPIRLIKLLESLGIRNIILLDLFRVGQKIGGIPPLYLDIVKNFTGDIYVGGGIKNYRDILDYKEQNFAGILIATALYDGTINIDKLKSLYLED